MQEIDKKLIVFESRPDFSDNSRGLWEYINKNTDYKTFWVIYDERMLNILKSNHIECAMVDSEEANMMISRAQYLISSDFIFADRKRIGQIHISLWHGFPLKVIGFFDSATDDRFGLSLFKFRTTSSDMISVTSRFSRVTESGMFAADPRKVKETGYPRNDIMLTSNAKEELKKLTNIDVYNSKLFFYLPTMRKAVKDEGESFSNNIFNYQDYNADELDYFLEKNNAYIFAKVHFADNALYKDEKFRLPKRMFLLQSYDLTKHLLTIYHIMDAFDALITDYSSVYVDYMLLNKPIIFSCPDLRKYQNDRGFIVDDPKLLMPGAICQSQSELLDNLSGIVNGQDVFRDMRKEKMPFFHSYQDANSAKRVLDEMEIILKNGGVDASKEIAPYHLAAFSPLYQYTKHGKAEVFIDYGDGYSEKNKYVEPFNVSSGESKVRIVIHITHEMKGLRLDPDDTGRWILKNLKVTCGNETLHVVPQNYFLAGSCMVPENSDPQLYIDITNRKGEEIIVQCEYIDILSDEGRKFIKEINQELIDVKLSASWRMTKPLRGVKKVVKPVLKKMFRK